MKLALGKFTESPFKREALEDVRKKWAQLLEVPNSALCRAEGQPFMLDMMAQTLEDPDWKILTSVTDSQVYLWVTKNLLQGPQTFFLKG